MVLGWSPIAVAAAAAERRAAAGDSSRIGSMLRRAAKIAKGKCTAEVCLSVQISLVFVSDAKHVEVSVPLLALRMFCNNLRDSLSSPCLIPSGNPALSLTATRQHILNYNLVMMPVKFSGIKEGLRHFSTTVHPVHGEVYSYEVRAPSAACLLSGSCLRV